MGLASSGWFECGRSSVQVPCTARKTNPRERDGFSPPRTSRTRVRRGRGSALSTVSCFAVTRSSVGAREMQAWRIGSSLAPWSRALARRDLRAGFVRERFRRGTEFGAVRAVYEQWSGRKLIARLAATPLLVGVVLARAARDAVKASWFYRFLWTLPLQMLGHSAWALGEAKGYAHVLIRTRGANP